MTLTEAQTFRAAWNAYVKRITRMSKVKLAALYAADMRERNMFSLYGGPRSKDELVGALTELHYPHEKLNEAIHVTGHDVIWPDCQYCQVRSIGA